jgi:hypothetical protein
VFDEEQDVQQAQERRVDVKEVSRQDRVSLGRQEPMPRLDMSAGCGIDTGAVGGTVRRQ